MYIYTYNVLNIGLFLFVHRCICNQVGKVYMHIIVHTFLLTIHNILPRCQADPDLPTEIKRNKSSQLCRISHDV